MSTLTVKKARRLLHKRNRRVSKDLIEEGSMEYQDSVDNIQYDKILTLERYFDLAIEAQASRYLVRSLKVSS